MTRLNNLKELQSVLIKQLYAIAEQDSLIRERLLEVAEEIKELEVNDIINKRDRSYQAIAELTDRLIEVKTDLSNCEPEDANSLLYQRDKIKASISDLDAQVSKLNSYLTWLLK